MKRTILMACAALLLIAADAPKEDAGVKEVEKAITALNDAFKKNDADAIKKLTTDDHTAVSAWGGVQSRDDQFKTLADLKMTEYAPIGMKVKLLTKDVALVSYALTLKGTFKGNALPAKNQAVAVWVKREGKWLEANYQETPLGK